MSKRMKRCPNCGGQMPAGARLCRKCQAKRDAERAQRLETLPKPTRPEEVRRPDAPKPVETARRPASSAKNRRKNSASTGQLVAVLAVIVLVIVVAVVLVVKMNQTTPTETSDEFNGVHILNQDGEDITPTAPPEAEQAEETVTPSLDDPEEPDTALPEEEPEEVTGPDTAGIDIVPTDDTVYVAGSGVNLREGPSTTYEVVATLSRGVELTRTGTVNGWSQVEYEGQTCYVSNSLVSTEKEETPTATPVPSGFTVTAVDDTVTVGTKANLRTGPDTTYDVVDIVDVGTQLTRTGTYGHWSQVVYDGREVFINNNMLKNKGETTSTSTTTTTATTAAVTATVTAQSGTLTVVSDAHVRSGPGTTYTILGTVKTGETLTVTGLTSTNWYQISYDGQTGYVAGNLVEKN
jgi:uncharacterized protein YgiM (DUF1202 family)